MYSESSVASPEDLDCYEECVVSDELYLSSSPTGSVCTPSALSDSPSRRDRIPKSNSGRITKKCKANYYCNSNEISIPYQSCGVHYGSFIGLGKDSSHYQWSSMAICVVQDLFLMLPRCPQAVPQPKPSLHACMHVRAKSAYTACDATIRGLLNTRMVRL